MKKPVPFSTYTQIRAGRGVGERAEKLKRWGGEDWLILGWMKIRVTCEKALPNIRAKKKKKKSSGCHS